jgi:hypothetical protein
MADGATHDVPSLDVIGCGPASRTCALYGAGDEFVLLDIDRIVGLEPIGDLV